MAGLIAALDTDDIGQAARWAGLLQPTCPVLKLGLAFYLAHGVAGVLAIGGRVFLDLKLHDIPNTVAAAVAGILPLRPAMLTVHAAGGGAMVAAARAAAGDDGPAILAVTVLTSLDDADLEAAGFAGGVEAQVLRLARVALQAGADGLVCAPGEIAALRAEFGPDPILVVPGIRPSGAATHDQRRTATPRVAAEAGADWLVVGRPITEAADPVEVARAIAGEIA